MSCSVVLLPTALLVKVIVDTVGISAGLVVAGIKRENDLKQELSNMSNEALIISDNCLCEKTYETVFVDGKLLYKTLEEHGVKSLNEDINGNISCKVDSYALNFERTNSSEPFSLTVKTIDTEIDEDVFGTIGSEYAINVQEKSYNTLIESLKEKNLEIESEEIDEDNTIVLTINLE